MDLLFLVSEVTKEKSASLFQILIDYIIKLLFKNIYTISILIILIVVYLIIQRKKEKKLIADDE